MIFRYKPHKMSQYPLEDDWSRPISDKLIKQVIQNQMKSTYSSDYVNNVEQKQIYHETYKHLSKPSTISRLIELKAIRDQEFSKQPLNKPFTYESLFNNPTRYGSNIRHQDAAQGIVPSCSSFWYEQTGSQASVRNF